MFITFIPLKSLFIVTLIILFINLLLSFVTLIDKVVSYVIIHRNLNLLVIVAIFYFLKKNIVGASVKKKKAGPIVPLFYSGRNMVANWK